MESELILTFLRDLRNHLSDGLAHLSDLSEPPDPSDQSDNSDQPDKPDKSDLQPEQPDLPPDFAACLRNSLNSLEGYRIGRRPLPDEWQEAFGLLFAMVSDLAEGVISPASAETLLRAVSFDRAVETARREGEIAGRNVRIEEQLRSPIAGDGLPSLQGSRSATPRRRRSDSIFDLAEQAR